MFRMRHRRAKLSAIASTVVLAGVFFCGPVHAQGFPTDVFQIDRFANVHWSKPSVDATVRITNPGSTGLRAWGTHVENTGSATETAFQQATLSSAELGVLTEKCGDIADNGSGFGRCSCGDEPTEPGMATGATPGQPPPGTLCAMFYVFTADQQLAECCGCPVTPNGLRTLSVANDLTSNPLTGDLPQRGVIKLLSATPGSSNQCDPATPSVPVATTTTTTTTPGGTSTTTTLPGSAGGALLCEREIGVARLDCKLQGLTAAPECSGTMGAPLQRLVTHKVNAMRRNLQRAISKGDKAFNRSLANIDGTLAALRGKLSKAAKRRRIAAACQTSLQQEIAGLRGQLVPLRR